MFTIIDLRYGDTILCKIHSIRYSDQYHDHGTNKRVRRSEYDENECPLLSVKHIITFKFLNRTRLFMLSYGFLLPYLLKIEILSLKD